MIKKILILALMAVALAFSVSAAANMTAPASVAFSEPEDIFQNTSMSLTFDITNNGDVNLTNVSISTNAASKYAILFNGTAALNMAYLPVNQTATIKVGGYIPKDESVGNKSIGQINVSSGQFNAPLFYMYADVKSKLRISDLDIEVGDKTDANLQSKEDGYKIDADAEPEDDIEFRIKLKNDHTKSEDIDIENILVTIKIDSIDLGEDLEAESTEFDLDPTEDEIVTLTFNVPLKVDEEEYDVEILIEGEDKNKVDYRIVKNFVLEVDKKSHEIRIYRRELDPDIYECSRKGTLDIEVMNTGSSNEDEVELEVKSSDLGIDVRERDIELGSNPDDDDNSYTKTIPINLSNSLAAGTYKIDIRAYYSKDIIDDYKQVELVVKDCVAAAAEEEEEEPVEVVQKPVIPAGGEIEPTTEIIPTATTEVSFMESPAYLAVLALGVLIITGAIIALAAKLILIKKP